MEGQGRRWSKKGGVNCWIRCVEKLAKRIDLNIGLRHSRSLETPAVLMQRMGQTLIGWVEKKINKIKKTKERT